MKGNRRIPAAAYTGPVQAVVLDWAGTAVDYGCMGPAATFVEVFAEFGVTVDTAEARRFMGLEKKDHIRHMCRLPAIVAQWQARYGRQPDNRDIDALYERTAAMMVSAIARHADPITGLLPFVDTLRARGIKIGSCTGYTAPMMAVLTAAAAQKGYVPDCVVNSSEVPAGRPDPWMCYLNAIRLQVFPFASMIKIGDTISDIQEGRNAGMWTIGITLSGNEMGLSQGEVDALPAETLERRLAAVTDRLRDAGAHYVVKGIWDCLAVVDDIGRRLKTGDHPHAA